ncbi:hypothetical protein BOTBODRAFT_51313 [Botryobasidium botryosum FD-172 SS1]|uniref:Nuclear protein DGCR14 n=1 Tax=Botryobasidium botryosum (strain FD-172 SS1) TaxID=930990 RepID=A0A067MWG8_BOTB1|nr:hypothetical protein BOTBODRAFT_51313 [Botryobasidium botryosum FD-172 SS1]
MATPRQTPGASSSKTSSALTIPQKPEFSLNKQVILDEDEYTSALSTIIARDFFPSLSHLDATNSYLSALDSQDPALIDASVRRLAELETPSTRTPWSQTPGQTPYGGLATDTPLRTPRGRHPAKKAKYDASLSLDAFQAQYTSEDNASFTEILDEENRKRKEAWGWAWEAQKRVESQKAKEIEGRETLLIEAKSRTDRALAIDGPSSTQMLIKDKEEDGGDESKEESGTGGEDDEEELAVALAVEPPASPPRQQPEIDVMAPKKDTRSTVIPGWSFKARNGLMFPPDADSSPYHPPPQTTTAPGPPKSISYSSTRLPSQLPESSGATEPPSPSRSRVGAAIAGEPVPDTPRVSGFGFVSAVPSPSPSELGPERLKQLMTWGTLQGTPRVLGESAGEPNTPFHIAPPKARDVLGRKLGQNAGKSLSARAAMFTPRSSLGGTAGSSTPRGGNGSMAPPIGTPRRGAELLSPAARSLFNRTKGGGLGGWQSTGNNMGKRESKELDLRKVGWSPRDSPVVRRG